MGDPNSDSAERPRDLPWCRYPGIADVHLHGLQHLPADLPMLDLAGSRPYRSERHRPVGLEALAPAQTLETAKQVARSFARREPMGRHLKPPASPPARLADLSHADPFGTDPFGAWSADNILCWFIRLLILTDPTSPASSIRLNEDALSHSLAVLAPSGRVIGGAFNETMPPMDVEPPLRGDDAFLEAVFSFVDPVLRLLQLQESEALTALSRRYPAFADAYASGKVGHHFMVARADDLAKADTFELVAATAEHFQRVGYHYMCIEATNQWTGAACEALGGVRVHFIPFRKDFGIRRSDVPLPGIVTSPSGFLSDKDSGSMFYVIRLGS
jgi:hypothetical protein